METLVNRTPGAVVGTERCRCLILAPDRDAAQPHIIRLDAAAGSDPASEAATYEWQWVPLVSLAPLLREPEAPIPPLFTFPASDGAAAHPPDLILCLDEETLGVTGRLALLRLVREYLPDVPLLLLVGEINSEEAVETLRAGATDLLCRRDWSALPRLVERARKQRARIALTASRRAFLEREREGELRRLRASEEKYRALFDLAPEAMAVVQSITGTLLLANRALADLLGQGAPEATPPLPADLVGRHLSVLFPPEAEAEADRFLLRLREENGAVEGRYFLRQEGAASAPLPVDLRAVPVPWGRLGAVIVTFRDAALRVEAGAGTALAYFSLDRLGESRAGTGAWVFWTGADGAILHANRPFCDALHRPLTLLRGRHIGEIAPALGPAAWALHRSEARAYGAFQIEASFSDAEGAPVPAEATAHALTLGGREYHCFIGKGRERGAGHNGSSAPA